MKQIAPIALALSMMAAPAAAEDEKSLMEQGAELFFRGLMSEMEPTIDELRDLAQDFGPTMQQFAEDMGPALADLLDVIDNIGHYQSPEILPNGDIIIRRKPDAPAFDAPESGEIEL